MLPDQPPSVHSLERTYCPVNSFVVSWPLNKLVEWLEAYEEPGAGEGSS